jgi:hypothetical protein
VRLSDEKPARLIAVQHALIDLVDFLDPDSNRFSSFRNRLEEAEPAGGAG